MVAGRKPHPSRAAAQTPPGQRRTTSHPVQAGWVGVKLVPAAQGCPATHHGEALARPVERGAQAAQLRADGVAVLLLPREDLLQESLATQLLARDPSLARKLLLNHRLRRNASVVGPCRDADSVSKHRQGSGLTRCAAHQAPTAPHSRPCGASARWCPARRGVSTGARSQPGRQCTPLRA